MWSGIILFECRQWWGNDASCEPWATTRHRTKQHPQTYEPKTALEK